MSLASITSAVTQGEGGGLDIFWILLPLLCCAMAMSQRRGEERGHEAGVLTDSWYTAQSIDAAYKSIEDAVSDWRRELAESREGRSLLSRLRRGRPEERMVVKEEVAPRLYRLSDRTGPVYFEFTEVEGGGTVVKATYAAPIKGRVARFKAAQPLKIPAPPIGDRCPSCGKAILREFALCPYCGEKLIEG